MWNKKINVTNKVDKWIVAARPIYKWKTTISLHDCCGLKVCRFPDNVASREDIENFSSNVNSGGFYTSLHLAIDLSNKHGMEHVRPSWISLNTLKRLLPETNLDEEGVSIMLSYMFRNQALMDEFLIWLSQSLKNVLNNVKSELSIPAKKVNKSSKII